MNYQESLNQFIAQEGLLKQFVKDSKEKKDVSVITLWENVLTIPQEVLSHLMQI